MNAKWVVARGEILKTMKFWYISGNDKELLTFEVDLTKKNRPRNTQFG